MPDFLCQTCDKSFAVQEKTLKKFPGWKPKACFGCKNKNASGKRSGEENLSTSEVLAKHTAGPVNGIFTDGAADPNPGPGGWGAVYVIDGVIVAQDHGHERATTNNRMELTALIEACRMIPPGTPCTVYTDSQLCVNTFTLWAKAWAAKGWKRKGKGEVKNLDLVRHLHEILEDRPEIKLQWTRAHSGTRWNEYADSLATAYRRKEKVERIGKKFDAR